MEIFIALVAVIGSFLIVSFAGQKLQEAWEKGIWNTIGLLVGIFGVYFLVPYVFTFLANSLHKATGVNPLLGGVVGVAIVIAACVGIGWGIIKYLKPDSAIVKTLIWCISLSAAGAAALGLLYVAADEMTYVWVITSVITAVVLFATVYYWREKGQDVLGIWVAYIANMVMSDLLLWSTQGIHLWRSSENYAFGLVAYFLANTAVFTMIFVLQKQKSFGSGIAYNSVRIWTAALIGITIFFTLLGVSGAVDRYEMEAIRAVVQARFDSRDADMSLTGGTPLGKEGSQQTFAQAQISLATGTASLDRDTVKAAHASLEEHLRARRQVYGEHREGKKWIYPFELPQNIEFLILATTDTLISWLPRGGSSSRGKVNGVRYESHSISFAGAPSGKQKTVTDIFLEIEDTVFVKRVTARFGYNSSHPDWFFDVGETGKFVASEPGPLTIYAAAPGTVDISIVRR